MWPVIYIFWILLFVNSKVWSKFIVSVIWLNKDSHKFQLLSYDQIFPGQIKMFAVANKVWHSNMLDTSDWFGSNDLACPFLSLPPNLTLGEDWETFGSWEYFLCASEFLGLSQNFACKAILVVLSARPKPKGIGNLARKLVLI